MQTTLESRLSPRDSQASSRHRVLILSLLLVLLLAITAYLLWQRKIGVEEMSAVPGRTYHVRVDYTRPISSFTDGKRYRFVNQALPYFEQETSPPTDIDITLVALHVPDSQQVLIGSSTGELSDLKVIGISEAARQLDALGYRPTTLHELLSLGEQLVHFNGTIVAAGSTLQLSIPSLRQTHLLAPALEDVAGDRAIETFGAGFMGGRDPREGRVLFAAVRIRPANN